MAKNSASKKTAAASNMFSPPGDDPVVGIAANSEDSPIVGSKEVESVSDITEVGEIGGVKIFTGFAPPAPKKRGFQKKSKWPFATLEVGQAFTIAPTTDKPEPWKSMASTVNAAQQSFSEVTGTKTTKKGKVMNVRKHNRKFNLYPVEMADGSRLAIVMRTE